jgi:hypothetical protein
MKHLPVCRTNLKELFPNYGSDCTCGAEFLLDLISQSWDDGIEAVVEGLNETIVWRAKTQMVRN